MSSTSNVHELMILSVSEKCDYSRNEQQLCPLNFIFNQVKKVDLVWASLSCGLPISVCQTEGQLKVRCENVG